MDPNARTFAVLSGPAEAQANAVRATVRRTSARGNALALPFASVVGLSACDVVAIATATLVPDRYGVVGLDYVKMGGNTTASYWSSGGGSGSAAGKFGNIASNGDITLAGSSYVNGNARPGTAGTVYGSAGRVSGTAARLKQPLTFASVDPSPYSQYNNDNGNLPWNCYSSSGYTLSIGNNKTVTLAGGVYCLGGLTLDGTVTFAAPTTIYVWGPVAISGTVMTAGNLAKNLKIYTVPYNGSPPPGSIQVSSGAALRAFIYAPQSPATFSGNGDFYGAIVAKSVDMTGTSSIYYDLAVSGNGGKSVVVR